VNVECRPGGGQTSGQVKIQTQKGLMLIWRETKEPPKGDK